MSASRVLYALMAVAALAFPVRHFATWLWAHRADPEGMIAALFANDLVTGLIGVLVLTNAATVVFIVSECTIRRDRLGLIAVPVTMVYSVAVGLPLYLYLRLRPIE